ncbi:MAG: TolC family protein [Sandaracinaceae bacterium]
MRLQRIDPRAVACGLLVLSWSLAASAQDAPETQAVPSPVQTASMAAVAESEAPMPEFLAATPGGMTADRAAQLAVDTAPSVRRSRWAHRAARAQVDQAVSRFVPRFDFSASYTRINEVDLPPFEIPGLPPSDNPFPQILDMYAVRGSVQIPVTDYFFIVWPSYEGALGFVDATEHQVEAERQSVAFRAREAFYNHVRAQAGLWIAGQSVTSLEATLGDVESLQAAGVAARADAAQVRARLASARAMTVQARGQVRVTERVLRRLLHLPADVPIRIGEDLFSAEVDGSPSERTLVDRALEQRAEVAALRTLVDARQSVVQARTGTMLPRVSLVGNIETSSPNQRVIPQTTDFYTTWALGASVAWSPNDAAIGYHQVAEAEAELGQVREDLEQLHDGIAIEAAQAVAAHEAAREQINASREAVAAAQLSLDDRREMLRAGVATTTEVTTAQLDLTRAQLELVNAYVDLHVAGAQVARVVGEAAPRAAEGE